MLALHEIQTQFARAMFAPHGDFSGDVLLADGMAAETRLDVYRNNILISLTDVLKDRFTVVCRVVDERFFLYVANEFIRVHPPSVARLSTYGERFADFLTDFPPCRHLEYLGDLARLEWLMHRAAHSPELGPISAGLLAASAQDDPASLVLELCPSLGYLRSNWPIDLLWRANRNGTDDQASVDLGTGGVCIEVRRLREEIGMRRLPAGVFRFREALQAGATLEAAAEAAFSTDSSFDLGGSIAALLHEQIPGRIHDDRPRR